MRKYLTLCVLVCVAMAVLSSCCKKKDMGLAPPAYGMTTTIMHADSSITNFAATGSVYAIATDNVRKCIITASDTAKNAIVSNITLSIYYYGTGRYQIDNRYTFGYYETISPVYSQTAFISGYVTISEVFGEVVSGSFYGVLADGSVVSNGFFTTAGTGF